MSAAMSPVKTAFLIFVAFTAVYCGNYKPIEVEIKTNEGGVPLKIFSAEEIAKYDGTDPEKPIYLAMKGVVFDVTSGKSFYVKQSDYNVLAGKDASRAHALWSLDEKDLTHDLTGLDDEQLKGLDDVYTGTYLAKYPIVGYMDHLIAKQSDDIKKRFTNDEL
ncbi:neudesin-like [Mercenaria mercenaria]|uniref:neudesin-like n=1 Tax=Mercenaria mercenaria TaxID=6596 RepID=UPI001E1DFA9D|nr:neudesin-like [Mercenaria mercenaria]